MTKLFDVLYNCGGGGGHSGTVENNHIQPFMSKFESQPNVKCRKLVIACGLSVVYSTKT